MSRIGFRPAARAMFCWFLEHDGDFPDRILTLSGVVQNKPSHREGPIAVRVGNVAVKIYRVVIHGYDSFQVADYSTGSRRLKSYSTERQARDAAELIAVKLSKQDGAVLALSSSDRSSYIRALELLKPTGASLEVAAAQFSDAFGKLGGRSLGEAVGFFLKHTPSCLPQKSVSEVFAELLKAKAADGLSEVYLKDLRFRLGKLCKTFHCQISAIEAAQVNEWLRSMSCGARGRNNYRLAVGTLFKFAESLGYIHSGQLSLSKVARAKEGHTEIEIFTPGEMEKLLAAAKLDPDNLEPGCNRRYALSGGLVPFLVQGGFAGLRTAEIERQLWEDINLERAFIRVTGGIDVLMRYGSKHGVKTMPKPPDIEVDTFLDFFLACSTEILCVQR